MEEVRIDWESAKVSGRKLRVALEPEPDKRWRSHFERTLHLLASSDFDQVSVKKAQIRVEDVRPGAEEKLKYFLEAVVDQANSARAHEEESAESQDGAGAEEQADDEDAQLTAKFRAFAAD